MEIRPVELNERALRIALGVPCEPPAYAIGPGDCTVHGSCRFAESTPFYADHDLGTGAVVPVNVGGDAGVAHRGRIRLTWLDWNHLEFEEVPLSVTIVLRADTSRFEKAMRRAGLGLMRLWLSEYLRQHRVPVRLARLLARRLPGGWVCKAFASWGLPSTKNLA